MQKTKVVCNQMWKKWKLQPWWNYHYKEGVLRFILGFFWTMRWGVRISPLDTISKAQMPFNIQNGCVSAAQVTVPEALGWLLHSNTQGEPPQWAGDVNVLGKTMNRGICLPQRYETSSMIGRNPAPPPNISETPLNDQVRFCPLKPG